MGLAVGSCGYYSKASGTQWVTPQRKTQTPLIKN